MLPIIESDIEIEDFIEISSIVFPISIKLIMKPPVSRYMSSPLLGITPITKDDKLPIEINVSILKLKFLMLFNADK